MLVSQLHWNFHSCAEIKWLFSTNVIILNYIYNCMANECRKLKSNRIFLPLIYSNMVPGIHISVLATMMFAFFVKNTVRRTERQSEPAAAYYFQNILIQQKGRGEIRPRETKGGWKKGGVWKVSDKEQGGC